MDDFTRINAPRVEKILKMIETIETSARSNSAEDRMAELLEPVYQKLGVGGTATETPLPRHQTGLSRQRMDFSIACSKADRAYRSMEKMLEELTRLKNAIPKDEPIEEAAE